SADEDIRSGLSAARRDRSRRPAPRGDALHRPGGAPRRDHFSGSAASAIRWGNFFAEDQTMTETHRINSQLKRAQEGQTWHGPSLRELLEGVTAEQAAARPIPNAHSIWELVNHIIAWEQIARRRLEGEELADIPDEINFPPVSETSGAAWQATLQSLEASNRSLRDGIKKIDDARLEESASGASYSNYFLLHGVIQHDLYHAGQIALLKKAIR